MKKTYVNCPSPDVCRVRRHVAYSLSFYQCGAHTKLRRKKAFEATVSPLRVKRRPGVRLPKSNYLRHEKVIDVPSLLRVVDSLPVQGEWELNESESGDLSAICLDPQESSTKDSFALDFDFIAVEVSSFGAAFVKVVFYGDNQSVVDVVGSRGLESRNLADENGLISETLRPTERLNAG